MRARLVLSIVCWATACGAGASSRVRDIDGVPLPASAVAGARGPVFQVQCADGESYLVVTTPAPYLVGVHRGTVVGFVERDPAGVCDRILANRR